MRLVYAHFPINATIQDDNKAIEIRNFLGQKFCRRIEALGEDTIIKTGEQKDEIYIEGSELDNTSQTAAAIHGKCLVRHKDIRKFLDGVYVWAKGPMGEEKAL